MTEKPLTKRQKEILNFISEHIDSIGYPPTRNELSKHFGFRSPNAAESHLRALENKGVIRIEAGRSRGITLAPLSGSSLPPPGNMRTPLPQTLQLEPGDLIVLYTDGVSDRFTKDDYPGVLRHAPKEVASNIVQRFGKDHDDAACIAVRYNA